MQLKDLKISCGIGTGFNQKQILIDSRKIDDLQNFIPDNYIFFAIKGARHDGHDFIDKLYDKGIREFVIEKSYKIINNKFPDAIFYKVDNVLFTLQLIVTKHRTHFSFPVIGITGSNGKTIVKEWLSQLLENKYALIKSPKSYNSQIGVPLSVWKLNEKHELGIFEAGISQINEMQNLQKIIQPNIGIFTNIGTAHDEGFENISLKIKEKLKLFSESKALIYCRDDEDIHAACKLLKCKKITWGENPEAVVKIKSTSKELNKTHLELIYQNKSSKIILPFNDKASIENCMHCVTTMFYLGLPFSYIEKQLNILKQVPMRLELKEGVNNCSLVDDSYNNDYAGLEIAIDFINQQSGNKRKCIILSDMLQSGLPKKELYQKVNTLLKSNGIKKLIGIGRDISSHQKLFSIENQHFFEEINTFIAEHKNTSFFKDDFILIKGARKYGFEKITHLLQKKLHGTRLEINLNALTHNFNFYKSLLKPKTKIMAMVKAFAYGSGSHEIAGLLQHHKVDYLAVAYTDEAVTLRQKGISLPIMVMNPAIETFNLLITHKIEPEIYSISLLKKFIGFLIDNGLRDEIKIHIKFDTGMSRLGFTSEDFDILIDLIKGFGLLKISSVFTHLSSTDEESHNEFSLNQIDQFQKLSQKLEKQLGYRIIKHCLNSPGITRFPKYQMDMVRLGIGLYGVDTNAFHQDNLQMISTLKTSISQIKHIEKGKSIGYGRKGKANTNKKIATIAIGYADGFDRRFSNGIGKVAIHDKLYPVIGNVCMDMCMIDITGSKNINEGDQVTVFGEKPTILELANSINTISYEILTNVNSRVKRVFYLD